MHTAFVNGSLDDTVLQKWWHLLLITQILNVGLSKSGALFNI
jgi:hypothetical protein